ncbi:hypothetical protein J6590_105327 [Homalodisca vitripennis]|nr:hypothetical protein J6590_105327 [Homalodisca vitripennis]
MLRLRMPFLEIPVEDLMKQLDLCPLEVRPELADLGFLFKLVSSTLDYSDLLGMIDFEVPRMTRCAELFVHKYYQTKYLKFCPIVNDIVFEILHLLTSFATA